MAPISKLWKTFTKINQISAKCNLCNQIQGCHRPGKPGKPGKVRELIFKSGKPGKVRELFFKLEKNREKFVNLTNIVVNFNICNLCKNLKTYQLKITWYFRFESIYFKNIRILFCVNTYYILSIIIIL